jgi:RHH-type rel operon transcriptional repressor/antitoxin RelB
MITLRLSPEIEKRLDAVARRSGLTKSRVAREAILRRIGDLEDAHLVLDRPRRRGARVSLEQLEAELLRK